MELVRRVDQDEVLAAWVRAETTSERFAAAIEVARAKGAVTPVEVLTLARGWPNTGYFEGFPQDFEWWQAELTAAELLEVKYIDWGYWLEVSEGTRLPRRAIEHMGWDDGKGLHPDDVEPLILVTDAPGGSLVVLEGHSRLTSFVIARERLPARIACYVGISSDVTTWGCF